MTMNPETEQIVEFVREQRTRVKNQRQFRRRIGFFGFSIEDTDDGPMIAKLPRRRVVCPAPPELLG